MDQTFEKRKKVKFFEGAKNALKNKYLWIVNISNVVGQWQWLIGNLLQWWFIYSLREQTLYGLAASVVVIGMTPGNLLCVWLTKKFEKRDVLLISRAASVLATLGMLLAIRTENIFVFLLALFLRNTIQPVDTGVITGLGADVQIYHQWKFGERCDSISGIFTWFTNPLNLALGYLSPWILELIGFTSDWDVLYDTEICGNVFSIHVWFTVISLFLTMIPFFFYNLTKEKHDMCVKELKERLDAAEEDTADISDEDESSQEVAQ